jgi:hypothetical protein
MIVQMHPDAGNLDHGAASNGATSDLTAISRVSRSVPAGHRPLLRHGPCSAKAVHHPLPKIGHLI